MDKRISKNDEIVFVWIAGVWLSLLLYFNPRLLALMDAAPNLFARLAVIIFVVCLDFFWLLMVYHVAMIGVSIRLRQKRGEEPVLPALSVHPPVAVLYTTRNDFREEAVHSCLDLDYPEAHVFILDYSTSANYQKRIDDWASTFSSKITIIRRPTHEGFKAGNLNNALRQIKDRYPYFVICDADGILPKKFITSLLPYFAWDPQTAFVQALQKANPAQDGFFGRTMGYMVMSHYRHFVRAKNRFGFVMFYGHGALLATKAWEAVGGFPEVVTEDLAFAAKVREHGFRGYYTERVECLEDFPPTYGQFRVRTEKWIRGTTLFLKSGYPIFVIF